MKLAGGIDLGGTKVEAQLFDPTTDWDRIDTRTLATPREDYESLLGALAGLVRWLWSSGAGTVGIGAPGLTDVDGRVLMANLPATGRMRRVGGGIAPLRPSQSRTCSH